MTRESIHYNMNVEFHPLAHLSSEHEEILNQEVQPVPSNVFKTILEKRMRNRKVSRRNPIPHFYETQVVFMRDQAPTVSSILKTPNKGPFRIERLEDRNVLLVELGTGKAVHSHVQYIRPLEMSELRLLLSKNWSNAEYFIYSSTKISQIKLLISNEVWHICHWSYLSNYSGKNI